MGLSACATVFSGAKCATVFSARLSGAKLWDLALVQQCLAALSLQQCLALVRLSGAKSSAKCATVFSARLSAVALITDLAALNTVA